MNLRRSGHSLVAKFTILISIPVLIVSLALSSNFIRHNLTQIETTMIERGKSTARGLARSSEYGLLVGNKGILEGVINRYTDEKDLLYILIRDESGDIMASYGRIGENTSARIAEDELLNQQGEGLNYRVSETDLLCDFACGVVTVRQRRDREGLLQPNMLSRSERITEKIGTVQIGLSKADMMNSMRRAKLDALWLTTGVVAIAILATVLLVRLMVRPVKRLAVAAGEVSRGDFDHPVKVKSKDEIGLLAESFNRMMADLKRSSEALQYRLEIERLVTAMSTNFINLASDEIDDGINHALETIGQFASVDRSYVFLFSDDGKKVARAIEWRTGETRPRIDGLKGFSIEAFPWAMQRLTPSGILHIPSVADLPPEASGERELLQSYDTQSFVGVPMIYGGSLIGLLGFDSVQTEKAWTEEDITLLKMVGEIFVNALERKKTEEMLQYQLEIEEHITMQLEEKTEELSRINEELNAFVYTVSHDLKAPVVSLQGFSSLLLKDCGDSLDEMGKMYIDRILKNSERMGVLIENLLELSRIGRKEGQIEPVSISGIVSEVINELAPQLEEKGTRLEVKDDMPTILCDRTRVGQVFSNLISNANKFMGEDNENPIIEVGYNDRGVYHEFYVKDNGIGIDEEYHEKVFQIFQRLDDIDTEGTGVGLAIVRKIVEAFGGKIWVNSAKGKGTTMYFTVPC